MKRKLKKGFTLVELVIVIAVIAILSAVLIPTFGNVINNAKESAAKSEVSNTITQYTTNQANNGLSADLDDGYIVLFKNEQELATSSTTPVNYTNSYKGDNISYVFSYNKGKLEMVKWKVKTEASATQNLVLTIGETDVALKVNGLKEIKSETDTNGNKTFSWTAEGTVVLDGKVVESTVDSATIMTLKGKVVLLTVVTP